MKHRLSAIAVLWSFSALSSPALPTEAVAAKIQQGSGFEGGFIVHLGCREGDLTRALGGGAGDDDGSSNHLVQGLDRDPENVSKARLAMIGSDRYGQVSFDRLVGKR